MNPIFRRPRQLAVAADDVDLVLFHQELQALGVLVYNALLALLDRAPVQGDAGRVLQPKFRAFLHVVVDLGVKQQRLGGNASDVQASSAQLVGLLDESCLES